MENSIVLISLAFYLGSYDITKKAVPQCCRNVLIPLVIIELSVLSFFSNSYLRPLWVVHLTMEGIKNTQGQYGTEQNFETGWQFFQYTQKLVLLS